MNKTAAITLACALSRRRRWFSALAVALPLAATLALGNAQAQSFPDRPIRLIVTHAAGGALDVSARQLAERLGLKLGQQVIVENRVGAAGMVATSFVAKAPADGYTLAFVSASFTILPVIYPNMNFQMSELTGVANVVQAPFVLAVAPNAPFKSFSEFVNQAKAQPNKFTWGSGGNGSFGHLLGAWFSAEADARITHVPYKGEAPAITALLSNDVTIVPINITSAIPLIKAGKLKALAVSGSKRSPLLPDVPTIAEQSVQVAVAPWFAMIAPAGVPKPILARLNQAVNEVLQERDLRDRFLNVGFEIGGGPESTLNGMIEREGKQWARIVKDRGVTFD
jgi:tripartite-type tricarboxylate transporter receptor subunit TctC